ncbi:MAG: hypothetical protein A3I44_02805 [Candidatus Sungbacteria bacterium RIFCSPLOWO2_02_FULL_51_17]|nr:MAG: hypothetical protein A2676_06180 [Candidatus Sungbacteria bacterium RIFCSPHIGHO2_01_FULL_51_22]OHA10825.1 MAG: hypothetical protein A3I44_02805 [Candidatus Sungbacteria bacterium RIFCSPLOWO2_02_FULL_51_17]
MAYENSQAEGENTKRPTIGEMRDRARDHVHTVGGEIRGLLADLQKMLETSPDDEGSMWGYYSGYTKDDV